MYLIKDPKVCDRQWYLCFKHKEDYEADHGHNELVITPTDPTLECETCKEEFGNERLY